MPQEICKCGQPYATGDGDERHACLQQRGPYHQARAAEILPVHFQITIAMNRTTMRASNARAGWRSGLFQVGF